MTDSFNPVISRRRMLRYMAVATGAAASLPLLGRAARTPAKTKPFGTVKKSALQYQDHPKGTSACANCANFIPGANAKASGHCVIVAGDISPQGWCLAYASNG